MDNALSWSDVNLFHKTQRAVYLRDRRIRSILCGGGGDAVGVQDLLFKLPKSPTYARELAALLHAFEVQHSFRVYQKLGINTWLLLGRGVISQVEMDDPQSHIFFIGITKLVQP